MILFTPPGNPIFRVADTGGEPVAVTHVESEQGSHFSPQFLPDGRHFLYGVRGSTDVQGVHVSQLGSAQSRRWREADPGAMYTSGHLLFVRQGTLFAQHFDPGRLELTGNAFPVAEPVASGQQRAGVCLDRVSVGRVGPRWSRDFHIATQNGVALTRGLNGSYNRSWSANDHDS